MWSLLCDCYHLLARTFIWCCLGCGNLRHDTANFHSTQAQPQIFRSHTFFLPWLHVAVSNKLHPFTIAVGVVVCMSICECLGLCVCVCVCVCVFKSNIHTHVGYTSTLTLFLRFLIKSYTKKHVRFKLKNNFLKSIEIKTALLHRFS